MSEELFEDLCESCEGVKTCLHAYQSKLKNNGHDSCSGYKLQQGYKPRKATRCCLYRDPVPCRFDHTTPEQLRGISCHWCGTYKADLMMHCYTVTYGPRYGDTGDTEMCEAFPVCVDEDACQKRRDEIRRLEEVKRKANEDIAKIREG